MGYSFIDQQKIQRQIEKKQATIERNSRKMKTPPKKVSVGWFKESGKYIEQPEKPSVAHVANIHNYGFEGQTQKAFIELTIAENYNKWLKFVFSWMEHNLRLGKQPDLNLIAEELGELVKSDLGMTVYDMDLIDTGRLLTSIMVKYKRR